MNVIKNVTPMDDYVLLLEFSDGVRKKYDMKPFLNSAVYSPLKDMALFRSAHIIFDYTVGWNNGIDICPDCAYRDGILA